MNQMVAIPGAKGPIWLQCARLYLGETEIEGIENNPIIVRMWHGIAGLVRDDETPWCAAFVHQVLTDMGIPSTRSPAARSYIKWGVPLAAPAVGCVVVFWRGSPAGWSGHVGFVAGVDDLGRLLVIGGNQGNAVSLAAFDRERVLAYRWPAGEPLPADGELLPVYANAGPTSRNEA